MMESIYDRTVQLGEYVPEPDDDRIICRCEEVTKGEIRRAVHDGMFTITEIRRYLRCGMGLCQGSPEKIPVGKKDRGGRAWSFPGTSGTGNLKSSYETLRDENLRKGR